MRKILTVLVLCLALLVPSGVALGKEFPMQTNVPLDKVWTVTFNEPIDISTVNNINAQIKSGEGYYLKTTFSFSDDRKKMTITPDSLYVPNTSYALAIKYVKSASGKSLNEYATLSFATGSLVVDKQSLPYTLNAKNGMSLTINDYVMDTSESTVNVTMKNNSLTSNRGELNTTNWSLYDGQSGLSFQDQDNIFWNTQYLRSGQSITGNLYFNGLSCAASKVTLIGGLWQYGNREEFEIEMELN